MAQSRDGFDMEASCLLAMAARHETGAATSTCNKTYQSVALRVSLALVAAAAVLVLGAFITQPRQDQAGRAHTGSAVGLFGLPSIRLPFMKQPPPPLPPQAPATPAANALPQDAFGAAAPAAPPVDDKAQYSALTNENPALGPVTNNFYMYRAGGPSEYPLENVNTADLEGVMWYLHNEVVTSAPRKYGIDRIRRYSVTVRNPQEFWNVHHRQFGPFLAFDAAKCTTVSGATSTCEEIFQHYGFVVGCQPVAATVEDGKRIAYSSGKQTNTGCAPGAPECYLPIWYSLPGPCPAMGIPQLDIDANDDSQDVHGWKTPQCEAQMPGGRCEPLATSAPDCTYSVWPAGEVLLDEMAGITNYQEFWNTSFQICRGQGGIDCVQNKEYDEATDAGIGNDFWNGRADPEKCKARIDTVKYLFQQKYPDKDVNVEQPVCDFDSIYEGEFLWPINHTSAAPSAWWQLKER